MSQPQVYNPTPSFAKVVQHSEEEKLANNLNPLEKYPGHLFGNKSASTTRASGYQGNRTKGIKLYLCIRGYLPGTFLSINESITVQFTLPFKVKFEIFNLYLRHLWIKTFCKHLITHSIWRKYQFSKDMWFGKYYKRQISLGDNKGQISFRDYY
mgnify:CR=1 FL=1